MAAAEIGIVQQEDVAGVDVVGEKVDHRLHRPGQGAHMHRYMLGLRH